MASITIPLYYDLDLLRFTTSAGGIARQPNLVLGQSDEIDFAVQFVQGGVGVNLPPITSIICGIKAINDVSGVYLANTTSVTQTGDGATRVYTFTLLLDSVELRAWLLTVTAVSNYAAFSILSSEHNIATLPAITCTILPDYNLTGTTPTAASGTLIVDSGQTFTVHKTFAMPVDDGTDTYVLKTNGAGVGRWAADSAGTGTVQSVAQSFTGGIISVGGSPVTTSGTLALTVAGTSGGIPYFSSGTAWATSGVMGAGALVVGGGAGATPTALAAVASGRVLTSAGTGTTPVYSSTITLGASGTLGTITLGNATSGTILITPPTGALGTVTLTLPITTTTLAGLAVAQTFTQVNTFSSSTASSSTTSGAVVITGGLGVGGNAYVGGVIDLPATTSTAGQITQAGSVILHTYGSQNVFIGLGAGRLSGTIGGANVAIGRATLGSLTSGARNNVIGDGVGYTLTSGSDNNIIGQASGGTISTGSYNCTIGTNSLKSGNNTSCIAIGYNALRDVLNNSSIGIGFNAGYSITGTAGANGYNTCIGDSSGTATSLVGGLTGVAMLTGTSNTMLGAKTSATSASGTYRTAIGCDSICESNNAIKLGRDTLDVVLLPKMTEAQLATAATTLGAVKGAIAYCTDGTQADHIFFYNGTSWARLN